MIDAFRVRDSTLRRIPYPTQRNGWKFRADKSNNSIFVWEKTNFGWLFAKRAACKSSTNVCRNCLMKKIWRRECLTPTIVFYLSECEKCIPDESKIIPMSESDTKMHTRVGAALFRRKARLLTSSDRWQSQMMTAEKKLSLLVNAPQDF